MRKGSAQAGDSGKKKLRIEYRAVDSLVPYARNARTHSDLQIDQVVASIREFGWTNPVLLDGENGIIAGHARVEAAKRIGLTDIPCIELAGLSEAQKRAYIIADNKLALNAGWDEDLLRLEMTDLADLDFNMELLGFEEDELSELMHPASEAGLTDPDDVPSPPDVPATRLGDLWVLGNHRLYHIECGHPSKKDLDTQSSMNLWRVSTIFPPKQILGPIMKSMSF
jgi:ParB-like chromosome segregation protein Spo0J